MEGPDNSRIYLIYFVIDKNYKVRGRLWGASGARMSGVTCRGGIEQPAEVTAAYLSDIIRGKARL